jgi:hypothetical protein
MNADTSCSRSTLAQGAHCKIELCDCGVLHLTIGPVTFRTTPDMTESFLSTLTEAVQRLGSRAAETCAGGWPGALGRKLGGIS